MTSSPDPRYHTLILSLAEMESVAQIEESLRKSVQLDASKLRTTLRELTEIAGREDRPARRALLIYLATIVDEVLPEAREESNRLSATAMATIRRARTDLTPLAAYRALVQFRDEFTDEAYNDLRTALLATGVRSVDPSALRMLYLVALASGRLNLRVDSLLRVALYRQDQGAYGAARGHYKRAVRLARDEEDLEDLFWATSAYAQWLVAVENYGSAADMFQEAMDAALVVYSEPGAEIATLRTRLDWAVNFQLLGRYTDALEVTSKTLAIIADLNEAMSVAAQVMFVPNIAELDQYQLRNHLLRGMLYLDVDELDLAEAEFDIVIERAKELNLNDLIFEAFTSSAVVADRRGDRRVAIQRYSQVVAIAIQWGDAVKTAAAYNNLGAFQLKMGALDEAFESYATALWHAGEAGAPVRTTCIALVGLGDVFGAFDREDEAITCYDMAYEKAAAVPDTDILILVTLRLMGNVRWWDADHRRRFEIVLEEMGDRLPPAQLASLTSGDAQLRIQIGDVESAARNLRSAMDLISARNPSAPELTSLRLQLGRLLAGNPRSRKEAFSLLNHVLDEQHARLAEVSSAEGKSELIAESITARGALIGLSLDHGTEVADADNVSPVERAFALHETAKAPSLAAHLGRVAALQPESVPPTLLELESRLLALARSTTAGGGRSEQSRRRRLREIEARLRDCWQEMRPYADRYVRLRSGQPATVDELQAVIEDSPFNVALASFFCDDETTTCFILRPGEVMVATRLPFGRERWITAGRTLRRLFNGSTSEWPPYPPIRRDKPYKRNFEVLDQLSADLTALLEPVRGVDLLCIAPHGPLHVIPFHSLRGADGRYLIENFGITYTPSLTTLLYALGSAPADAAVQRSAVVAGIASKDDSHPEYFENDESILAEHISSVRIMNGPESAAPEAIVRELSDYDIVHLTCHGFFDDRDPLHSGLILSNGQDRPPRQLRSISVRQRYEYLITAEQLLTLRLKAELVTLRACSTGLVGERNAGDEFDGLTRSFIHAGAGAVLASQWNVDQRSSQALISAFYKNWLRPAQHGQRLQKWQALRLAQLEFLNSTVDRYLTHPYHWGPLALLGDWR